MQTWALPYPYGLSTYFLVSHFNLKHIYTLEPPRIGFLYNSGHDFRLLVSSG